MNNDYLFRNYVVSKPFSGRINENKIFLGEKRIKYVGETYSHDYIDKIFVDKGLLDKDYKGKYKYNNFIHEYLENPDLFNRPNNTDRTIIWLDIENLGGLASIDNPKPITAITLIETDFSGNILNEKQYKLEKESDEKYKLKWIFNILYNKQDKYILTGWNISYDMSALIGRYSQLFNEPIPNLHMLPVIDYLSLYRHYISNTEESFKLDYILKKYLGEDKGKVEYIGTLDELWEKDRDKYYEYNFRDVEGLVELERKLGLFPIAKTLIEITGCLWTDVIWNSRIWQAYIYKYLKENYPNLVMKRLEIHDIDEKFEGAFVKCFKSGLYKDVVCYDFFSLYPNLIITFNISFETLVNKYERVNDPKVVRNELGLGFVKKDEIHGIIPEMEANLLKLRNEIKEKYGKQDKRYTIVKILANSGYGFLSLINKKLGASITAFAREIIKYTINGVKKFKIGEPIYSDTDSIYIKVNPKLIDDYEEIYEEVFKYILDEYTKSKGLSEHYLLLEDEYGLFEGIWFNRVEISGTYSKPLTERIKISNEPIKKKYILKIGDKIKMKGFDRTDIPKKGKELFKVFTNMMFEGTLTKDIIFKTIDFYRNNFEWANTEYLKRYKMNKNKNEYEKKESFLKGLDNFYNVFPNYKGTDDRGYLINITLPPKSSRAKKRVADIIAFPEDAINLIPDFLKIVKLSNGEIQLDIEKHIESLFKLTLIYLGILEG